MKKIVGYLLTLVFSGAALSACASSNSGVTPATESPVPSATPQVEASPMLAVTPTHTPLPTATLRAERPFLLYWEHYAGLLALADAAGNTLREYVLPPDTYFPWLEEAVSPDGNWLAFYTGRSNGMVSRPEELTLNLLSIPDGEIIPVARIFAENYQDGFDEVVAYYQQLTGEELVPSSIEFYLIQTSTVFAWSPDGRFLAYAGVMDGPSSDLYVYDVQTGENRRVTDDLRIMSNLSWSPDGKWIIQSNIIPYLYGGYDITIHRVYMGSNEVQSPPEVENSTQWGNLEWVSPDLYLFSDRNKNAESTGLSLLNVETGVISELWPGRYLSCAVNAESRMLLIGGAVDETAEAEDTATYLVTFTGQRRLVGDGDFYALDSWNGADIRFVGFDGERMEGMDTSGNVQDLGVHQFLLLPRVLSSPDGQYMLFYGAGIVELFSSDGQLLKTYPELEVRHVAWMPDSSAVFLGGINRMARLSVPDFGLTDLIRCPPDQDLCSYDLIWLP